MLESAELGHQVEKKVYAREEPKLREALLNAQFELAEKRRGPVLMIISGVESGGRGETANQLIAWMDPRHIRVHAFGPRTPEEQARPAAWRYWRALPPTGRIGVFMNAWYREALVERTAGRITDAELDVLLQEIRREERTLTDEGVVLLKFWIHLSRAAQKKRIRALEADPKTRWRITAADKRELKVYGKSHSVWEHVLRGVVDRQRAVVRRRGRRRALSQPHRRQDPARHDARGARQSHPARAGGEGGRAGAVGGRQHQADPRPRPHPPAVDQAVRAQPRPPSAPPRAAFAPQAVRQSRRGGRVRRRRRRRQGRRDPLRVAVRSTPASTGSCRSPRPPTRSARIRTCGASGGTSRAPGGITIFDRSWYGRVLVERVEKFCTAADWMRAYDEINEFEEQLDARRRRRRQVLAADQQGGAAAPLPRARAHVVQALQDHARRLAQPQALGRLREARCATWSTAPAPSSRRGRWSRPRTRSYARVKVVKTIADRIDEALG